MKYLIIELNMDTGESEVLDFASSDDLAEARANLDDLRHARKAGDPIIHGLRYPEDES